MYSAPFLLFVSSAKTRNLRHPLPLPILMLSRRTAKLSRYDSATAPRLMIRWARMCSYPTLMNDRMMHIEKIHFVTSNETAGWISEDHLLKASRLTAVNVSTAYTVVDKMSEKYR